MKKINIYVQGGQWKWFYVCSTMQSKTCKEAKAKFLLANPQYKPEVVKASFL